MEKYKIIFLGGVPGVGKTSISGSIAERFGIDIVLSGDYLREFTRAIGTPANHDGILDISVYEAWKHFGGKSHDNIIRGYEKQSAIMCAGIAATIERAAKNGESLIIESLYMNQDLIDTMKRNGVGAAYLYISDPDMHAARLNERELYTHFKSPGRRLSAQLDVYRPIMEHSIDLSKKNGIAVFDNIMFKETERDLLKFVGDTYADVPRQGQGIKKRV